MLATALDGLRLGYLSTCMYVFTNSTTWYSNSGVVIQSNGDTFEAELVTFNLATLMRISIEGPELTDVDFNQILDIFKEKNHSIFFFFLINELTQISHFSPNFGGEGEGNFPVYIPAYTKTIFKLLSGLF